MPLIGTAGHVDHGKSTLIHRITGRDPDRWDEEKQRGLTIDLGFAWTTLPNGTEVSFVDVPGHERFLKNMLAGIDAIDVALFVVAADEGWMPQSEEHLAVIDLLGIDRGVVALTKVDRVDADLADLAEAEVGDKLVGSSLEGARIHRVSGTTGEGVEDLLRDLGSLVKREPGKGDRPRMWVDRSFTVPGAGTVVTGSLVDGCLSIGDEVEIYPDAIASRIRGVQSHERSHETVEPGRRVALNLAGVDNSDIQRGDMVGRPGEWDTSNRFAVSLRPARFVDGFDRRGAYHIHVGSAAHRVDVLGLAGGYAIMRTDMALPLSFGDRFILRDTGRKLVVAGGRVLDPSPGPTRKALTTIGAGVPEGGPDDVAGWLLSVRGTDTLTRLLAHSGGGWPQEAVVIGDHVVHPDLLERLAARIGDMVDREHQERPLRAGVPIATIAERLGVGGDIAEETVERADDLERRGPAVARPDHRSGLTEDQEESWQRARDRLGESLAVPSTDELQLDDEVLHLKLREDELIRIGPELVYLPEQIEQIKSILRDLKGEFTVADFRDAAGLSRKYAVPILEWSDREGLTVRRGDVRRLR